MGRFKRVGSQAAALALTALLASEPRAQDAAASDEPALLQTATGAISGSLRLPSAAKPGIVVLLVAGSGPTDRDGNSAALRGHNDSLKMLAAALADAGFASLRYDKRGIGASVKTPETELRFEHYVEDAAGWARQLQQDARFSRVAVAGHSEGSLIGMLAARQANASAFVSIAGPAQGAAAILRLQLAGKLPADLAARNEAILTSLERGTPVGEVPAPLAALYRPSVQPYLVSWFKWVPADEFARLRMPALVLQGDTDIQVPVDEARALKAALPQAELVVVPGMNHVLKQVPPELAQQLKSYGDSNLPISAGLLAPLIQFLLSTP